jgi:hypothetical protein
MSTQRQIDANRRNGHKSDGPTDTTVTRYNPTKHGLRAPRLTPLDDQEEYERLRAQLEHEWLPANCIEQMLIEKAARYAVKATTAEKFESQFLSSELNPRRSQWDKMPDLAVILGPEKVLNPGSPAVVSHESFEKLLLYQRYGANFMNLFFRTMHELERIQRLRRGEFLAPPQVLDVSLHPSVPGQGATGINPRPTPSPSSDSNCTPQPTIDAPGVTDALINSLEANSDQASPDKTDLIRNGLQKPEVASPSNENGKSEAGGPKPKSPKHDASPSAYWQPAKPKQYWST